ncbi:MAG: hypothetical protein ACYDH2_14825 [Anaerolineaceae bacterium]
MASVPAVFDLTPSEIVLLHAHAFAPKAVESKYIYTNSLAGAVSLDNAFPLFFPAKFVSDRELGIILLTSAVYANLAGERFAMHNRKTANPSLDKNTYEITVLETAKRWADFSLESALYNAALKSKHYRKYLSVVIDEALPYVGHTTPWSDLCWSVVHGLYRRGYLTADPGFPLSGATNHVKPFSTGVYTIKPGLEEHLTNSPHLPKFREIYDQVRHSHSDLFIIVPHVVENVRPSLKTS